MARVIATSPDGVIEGIEDPSMPLFLGVQWHPERSVNEGPELGESARAIFRAFVAEARARHRERSNELEKV